MFGLPAITLVRSNLTGLTLDELHEVAARVEELRIEWEVKLAASFNVGDRVQYALYEGTVIERLAAIISEVEKDQSARTRDGVWDGSIPIRAGLDSLQHHIEETCGIRHDLEFSCDWEKTLNEWLLDPNNRHD